MPMLLLERARPARLIARDTALGLLGRQSSWVKAAGRAAGALALVLAFSGVAKADDISFPVTLDPTIPSAWLVAVYVHACGGSCQADIGVEFIGPGSATEAAGGFWDMVEGGGGAYSALTYGALAVSGTGFGDGAGTGPRAYLIVNIPLSGSGTNTVRFDIDGAHEFTANDVLDDENTFSASMSYAVRDAATNAVLDSGGDSANECEASPSFLCSQPLLSFPIHLSNSFSIDRPVLVQLGFFLLDESNGPLTGVDAVGLIALDLAPGVTMDGSSGFLSTPGDPHLVPEPATTWLSLAAAAALACLPARPRRG